MRNQKLHCYASGSGALSFVWLMMEDGRKVASGRHVKRAEAVRYTKGKDAAHLMERGYKLMNLDGNWQLVRVPKRIDGKTLRFKGEKFKLTYKIDKAICFPDGEIPNEAISARGNLVRPYKSKEMAFMNEFDLKNISVRAALRFFLNNEKRILEALKETK